MLEANNSSSGSSETTATTSSGGSSGNSSAQGEALYAEQCASCHGSDPANGRRKISRGTSASVTTRKHSFVDKSDAQAIAIYLNEVL
ncbi:c-type cytochrome [endosymbiont of Ridgeia piscesae]|uniref:c-type cytochrome n=1 Tax=endosymbiont of Ridgeia piscesae TaxID=54398 RepID=UPI000716E4DC|nr:c-type cytochrome [endosymbiont of Ridgeia piscesae]